MEILHRRLRATVAEVLAELPDPPSYSSVRKLLEILESKKLARHFEDGPRYVYAPAVSATEARRSALEQLMTTFFGGSAQKTLMALLDISGPRLSAEELDVIARLAEEKRRASEDKGE